MRAIDTLHLGNERVICAWELDGVLIDPGPQSTEATLLAALGDMQPRAILLTHIHFDHAGVTGALLRRWPGLPVYVHAIGAPHIVAPERLVKSAARLYGGVDELVRLWGEVIPVPEANLRVLEGGETVLGEFRVEYTPGHASHHVSYLHEPSGMAFVGDVAGVRIPPAAHVLMPTVPPDIDVEAWERSIGLVAGWTPAALALTHFGRVDDVESHLEATRASLHELIGLAARHGPEAFAAGLRERIAQGAGDVAPRYSQAAPPEQLYLGARRYLDKRAEARDRRYP
jgi:glyoxylase-like metal-dependent hydrolase (beta-lactamase superfamily II)